MGVERNYIFIDANEKIRMGQMVDEVLIHYTETDPATVPIGSIYRVRVKTVLPFMDCYRVQLSDEETAILPFKESVRKLVSGEQILVQLTATATQSKEARVSMKYTLRGRGMVLDPFAKGVRLSKKIDEDADRARLKALGKALIKDEDRAVVFRTKSPTMSDLELEREFDRLSAMAHAIQDEENFLPTPKLIYYQQPELYSRIERMDTGFKKIIVNQQRLYEELIRDGYREWSEYDPNYSVDYDRAVSFCLGRRITRELDLTNGSSLLFEELETLTVIDVNSGSYSSSESKEEMAFAVNSAAIREILTQLRIRGIGGIVVIDFIRMRGVDRERLLKEFETEFENYRLNGEVYGFTRAGLLELSLSRMETARKS